MPLHTDFSGSTIEELVRQDATRAALLHFLGIPFYEFSDITLGEACDRKGLRREIVNHELIRGARLMHPQEHVLTSWPTELIIRCLRHAHSIFTRERLPYIADLIRNCPLHNSVVNDLNILFPVFSEDFVHHIHMEEDRLFIFIGLLQRALQGKMRPVEIHYILEADSIHQYVKEHESHDDEMEGIRNITSDYTLPADAPLHLEVLYAHLQQLEEELRTHARIENGILFPKAAALEEKVRQQLNELARLN